MPEPLVLFPNKTWKKAVTDENGEAVFDLYTAELPMTVFAAAQRIYELATDVPQSARTWVRTWLKDEFRVNLES